ncbi:MAG: DUF2341 domain-containing protein [Promethearchaeota archaeon]|nr:MAG: DUF2341 domain-containing protein [Candidatus Lokiarchaeota archaeon]
MNFKLQNKTKRKVITISIFWILLFIPIFSFLTLNFMATSESDKIGNDVNNFSDETTILTSQGDGEDIWWNYSWQYRVPIDVASTNGDLTDYQVCIDIELTEWYENGYLNETGKDIRFTNSSGQELGFWIKNMNVTGGNSTIWVKIPDLKTTGTRIYMYMGNPDAISGSNGEDAFDFFDDFEGTSLDSKWYDSDISSGSHTVSNGLLTVDSGGIGLQDPLDFSVQDGYMVETKCLFNVTSSGYSGTIPETSSSRFTTGSNGAGDATILYMRQNGQETIYYWVGDGSTSSYNLGSGTTGWLSTNDEWYLTGVSVIGGDSNSIARLWRDGVNITSFTGVTWYKDMNYISLGYFNGGTSNGQDTSYDWIRIRKYTPYEPTISVGNVEYAQLNITCLDIDGQRISGAHVYISNDTEPFLNQNGTTDENGMITFRDIPTGYYNLTVNYTLNDELNPKTETVYYSENFHKIEHELEIHLNLWTIDFEVDDVNGEPLDYGYINISAEGSENILSKQELSPTGRVQFIWNASKEYYNYSVYYYNPDYTETNTLLYTGEVHREETYTLYDLNKTAEFSSGYDHYVEDNDVYLYDDSNYSGPNEIVEVRVICSNIDDNLTSINVRYSGADHITSYTDETSADITYKPYDDGETIYGIETLRINFQNMSQSDGTIQLNLTRTYNQKITVNMSKLTLRVLDSSGVEGVAGIDLKVRYNNSVQEVVTLETDNEGYAYGDFTTDFSFWYLNGTSYNFTLSFQGEKQRFDVEQSNQYKPTEATWYNYSLTVSDNIVFKLANINYTERRANFTDGYGPSSVTWGENMTFWVIYETTNTTEYDNWATDYQRWGKETFTTIKILDRDEDLLFEEDLQKTNVLSTNDGNFSITINSSRFSAGGAGNFYYAYIYGEKALWSSPERAYFGFAVNPISAEISLYNYTSLDAYNTDEIPQYYNELINISLGYNTILDNQLLGAETISYNWIKGGGTLANQSIKVHPTNSDYYYFTVDTSKVDLTGPYLFSITATKENYTTYTKYFNLDIKTRPTIVNNTIDASFTYKLDIFEARNFSLEYNDTLTTERIGECEELYYNWWKLDDNGNRMYTPGNFGTEVENITENSNKLYIIDFNTAQKALGDYSLVVHIGKQNYKEQSVDFFITIQKRGFTSSDLTDLDAATRTVEQGARVNIQLNLTDTSAGRNGDPLEEASVYIMIGGRRINLTESGTQPGIYQGTIPTTQYQTFFQGQTVTCKLYVTKENYETQQVTFNVNVKMMSIAGIPIFYLVLGISIPLAIVTALGIYRYVQVARIPEFVKRTNKIKKEIKKGKSISDKYLYQSKEEYIAEWYEDDWKEVDLSIEDALGLEKGSKKTLDDESMKGGAM